MKGMVNNNVKEREIIVNGREIDDKRRKAMRDVLVNWLDYEKMMVMAAGAAANHDEVALRAVAVANNVFKLSHG